jgi:TnpA family transposase
MPLTGISNFLPLSVLHASSHESALAKALHDYGRLIRIYVCRYVTDVELHRRVRRQLKQLTQIVRR